MTDQAQTLQTLQTLRSVFKQFRPYEQLEPGSPLYVETRAARHIDGLIETAVLQASSSDRGVMFLSGTVGDGKSTMLNQMRIELQAAGAFVVKIDAPDVLAEREVNHIDLVVVILAAIMSKLPEAFASNGDALGRLLASWQGFWNEIRRLGALPVELDQIDVQLGGAAKVVAKIRDVPNARLQLRQCLERAQSESLLGLVNQLLGEVQQVLTEAQRGSLVVLVDSLERLFATTPTMAPEETLFIHGRAFLSELEAVVVYTTRQVFVQEQYQALTVGYGTAPIIMPLVRLRERNGDIVSPALKVLRTIVERRVKAGGSTLDQVFGPDTAENTRLDRLCLASGGQLRTLMVLVQNALGSAGGSLPITDAAVDTAILNIAAPQRLYAEEHANALASVRKHGNLATLSAEQRSILLTRWLVYLYRDDRGDWYGVNPLCDGEKV